MKPLVPYYVLACIYITAMEVVNIIAFDARETPPAEATRVGSNRERGLLRRGLDRKKSRYFC